MNLWALPVSIMDYIGRAVEDFRAGAGQEEEIYLPDVIAGRLRLGLLTVRWTPSAESWTGVTNPEDLEGVRAVLRAQRPEPLWEG